MRLSDKVMKAKVHLEADLHRYIERGDRRLNDASDAWSDEHAADLEEWLDALRAAVEALEAIDQASDA